MGTYILMAKTAALRAPPIVLLTRTGLRFVVLVLLVLASMIASTLYGPTTIPRDDVLHILLYKLGLYAGHRSWTDAEQSIVWQIRVPRTLAAALVGAALSAAGTLFQAVLRNPLADPYVIGTAAGAQLGVIAALMLPVDVTFLGFGPLQLFAFAGAVLTVLFVYRIARTAGRTPVVTLLLAGFVVSSFLISAATFLMLISNRINQVVAWTMGSLDVSELTQLTLTGPLILLAVAAALPLAPQLDVMLLGEEHAAHLGVRVERLKLVAVVLASLLTALAVTLAGVVAFVGLVVPHAMRIIFGPGHRVLIPAAALGGATFVVTAGIISLVLLAPTPIPLGIVTSVIGAPLFIHLLRRSRQLYAV